MTCTNQTFSYHHIQRFHSSGFRHFFNCSFTTLHVQRHGCLVHLFLNNPYGFLTLQCTLGYNSLLWDGMVKDPHNLTAVGISFSDPQELFRQSILFQWPERPPSGEMSQVYLPSTGLMSSARQISWPQIHYIIWTPATKCMIQSL